MFRKRSLAYSRIFEKSIDAEIVLKDLAKFCRAHETTFDQDARKHTLLEGRREVWLRIQSYLKLTPEELYEIHKVKDIKEK